MELIKQGFFDQAIDNGLSHTEADHLWKRASEYPGTSELFKRLDINESANAPAHLAEIAKLMEQEQLQRQIQKTKAQLGI
jgi:hypothetical protein